MIDCFDVELRRVVRAVENQPRLSRAAFRACHDLVERLVTCEAAASGRPPTRLDVSPALFPAVVRTIAFDAQAAGVDLESLTDHVVRTRKTLTTSVQQ